MIVEQTELLIWKSTQKLNTRIYDGGLNSMCSPKDEGDETNQIVKQV